MDIWTQDQQMVRKDVTPLIMKTKKIKAKKFLWSLRIYSLSKHHQWVHYLLLNIKGLKIKAYNSLLKLQMILKLFK